MVTHCVVLPSPGPPGRLSGQGQYRRSAALRHSQSLLILDEPLPVPAQTAQLNGYSP
jgi:hypothetical protein